MIEEAARLYDDGGSEDIRHGTRLGLLDNSDADYLLETLKDIARRFLYPADRVQRPFLAGLKVIHGILDEYSTLLHLTQERFALLRNAWRSSDRGAVRAQELETLLPLLDGLPPHYLDVYDSTVIDDASVRKWGKEAWEWFCRAHLVVDYLSGMADDFAYGTYQVISGAPSATYLLLAPLTSLRSLDEGLGRRSLRTESRSSAANKSGPDIELSRGQLLFRVQPRISYVSDEFASEAQEFWRQK